MSMCNLIIYPVVVIQTVLPHLSRFGNSLLIIPIIKNPPSGNNLITILQLIVILYR